MSTALDRKREIALLIICVLSLIIIRGVIAANTGFWCDELAWIKFSIGSYLDTFENVRQEPGPHGPFDLLFIAFAGKQLINVGASPHLALRAATITLTTLTALIPFFSSVVSRREKWLWLLWTTTSTVINAMALNARPSAGLIFFSSCALFTGLEIIRGRTLASRFLWILLGVLAFSAIAHPYIIFPTFFLLGLVPFSKFSRKEKIKIFTLLTVGILLRLFWLIVIREPAGFSAVPIDIFLKNILSAQWNGPVMETLHSLAGLGTPLKLVLPFAIAGAVFCFRENRFWGTYLIIVSTTVVAIPLLLNVKYGLPFSARQTFAALPFWGWMITSAMSRAVTAKWAIRAPVCLLFFVVGVILPLNHWLKNKSPYVDIPRYELHKFIGKTEFEAEKQIIVLSYCHLESVNLYSPHGNFKEYFDDYGASRSSTIATPKNIIAWTSTKPSCLGSVPDVPDDELLLQQIRTNPSRYAVIAPFNVKVPTILKGLPCRTEINTECLF